MLLDVAALLASPTRVSRGAFRENVEVPEDVGRLQSPVLGGFVAEITGGEPYLEIKGEFRADLELVCHRCGNPFATTHDFEIDETLELVEELPSSVEVQDSVWSKGSLDLDDLVRQHLLLSLPTSILCGCAPQTEAPGKEVDPRWQALSEFHPSSEEDT